MIVPPHNPAHSRNLAGIGCMLLGMAGMGAVDASGKWLVGADYHVLQVIAVRGWVVSVLLLAWLTVTRNMGRLATRRPGGHLIRLVLAMVGPFFLFSALRYMPLADVTVIVFGSVFWTVVLSVLFFGEHIGIHRWGAVLLGFAGVAVAIRPGSEMFQPAALLALLAGLSFAGINLTARWLRETETTESLVTFAMVGMAAAASAALPWVWTPMAWDHVLVVTGMGAFTLVGYLFMTRAFMIAQVGVVAPFEYTILVYAMLFGYVIWGDVPDAYVWTGAGLIVVSGIYLMHRERRARHAVTPPSPDAV